MNIGREQEETIVVEPLEAPEGIPEEAPREPVEVG